MQRCVRTFPLPLHLTHFPLQIFVIIGSFQVQQKDIRALVKRLESAGLRIFHRWSSIPLSWWPFLPSLSENYVSFFFSSYHHHHLSTPLYSIPCHHTIVRNAPCIISLLTIDYPPSTPSHTILLLHRRELNPWGYPCCSEFSFVQANWSRWNQNNRQSSTSTVYKDRVDREGNRNISVSLNL